MRYTRVYFQESDALLICTEANYAVNHTSSGPITESAGLLNEALVRQDGRPQKKKEKKDE